ncbi:hypothetical protein [Pedococcus sp. 5OH_020]|uniref:hypothetical protein n=1 Tax=Pedococcus sp. 5OH_020 TaxID=2989814 RepID=UPI0022E9E458|nr:hypothetical protein [Pedococcus sp. 5OH_020]
MKIAAVIGLVLNVTGTFLAGKALIQDYRENAQGVPLLPWLVAARRWAANQLPFRGPVTASGTVFLGGEGILVAEGLVTRLIPDADAPTERQIEYLRREVDALHQALDTYHREADRRIDDVSQQLAGTEAKAAAATSEVELLARRNATSTVGMQLFGLLLIGIGSVVSVLPAVLGWN